MTHRKNTDFVDQLNQEFAADEGDSNESATSPAKVEDFAKMLGESLKSSSRKLSVGDKIKGKILVIGQEDVFISTGTRHDGVLAKRELLDKEGNCPYKVDDVVDVYVTQVRGSDIRLSRNATDRNLAEDLEDAFDMELPVQGRVVEVCKGGVRVTLKGKLAFCPISQLDSKHVESAEEYVGRSFDFRITQFAENGRNIVVSRRKLLDEERDLNSGSFLEENKDGDTVTGKVARLEKFGAFVELSPGVDGLVHISEIAWSRIGDPAEVLQVGQAVTVKILKREKVGDRVKISLSIKQTLDRPSAGGPSQGTDGVTDATANPANPWSKYTVGQVVTGKVNRKELYGLFVQLEPGITGLLHKSKALDQSDFHFEKLRVGDEITVQIGQILPSERRISLDLPGDPHAEDWRQHTQPVAALGSLGGAFGDKLKAAFAKKK